MCPSVIFILSVILLTNTVLVLKTSLVAFNSISETETPTDSFGISFFLYNYYHILSLSNHSLLQGPTNPHVVQYTARYVGTYNPWVSLGHIVQICSKSIYSAQNKKLIFNHQPSTKQLPSRSSTAVTSPRFNWIIRRFSWDVRLSTQKTRLFIANLVKLRVYPIRFFPLRSSATCLMRNFPFCPWDFDIPNPSDSHPTSTSVVRFYTFLAFYSKFHLTLAPFHPFNRPGGPSIQVAFPQRMMFQALNHLHHQSARHLPPTIASGFHHKTFGSDCVPQWHSTGWVNIMVKYMVKYGIGDVCFRHFHGQAGGPVC